jgi:hypothetical protein
MQDQLLTDRAFASEGVCFTIDHDPDAALKSTRARIGEPTHVAVASLGSAPDVGLPVVEVGARLAWVDGTPQYYELRTGEVTR